MFIELLAVYNSLSRWKRNPNTPKCQYRFAQWQTDDSANDVPVNDATVTAWKEMLRKRAPTAYRQISGSDV